jgi:ribosomal-protein-alanine N-acetyltransferase
MQLLRTTRLQFHHWQAQHLDDALALWSNVEVMAKLGGPLSPGDIAARLQREIDSQAQHQLQYWRLTTVSESRFIGCCGLKLTDLENQSRVVEMGFHLLPQAWGQGYATEASRAALRYAFDELAAPAVYSGHHPENAASQNVLAKLGFERIGERFWAPTGLMHPWYRLRRLPRLRP